MSDTPKYLPQSNVKVSTDPYENLQRQKNIVAALNNQRDVRQPLLTLEEYQKNNNLGPYKVIRNE